MKHITRNRQSYSCHDCRRRKIKCDKAHPTCSNCRKSGQTCVYNDDAAIPAHNPRTSPPEHHYPQQRRMSNLHGILGVSPDADLAYPGNGDVAGPSAITAGIKRRRTSIHDPGRRLSLSTAESPAAVAAAAATTTQHIESRLDKLTSMVEELSRKSFSVSTSSESPGFPIVGSGGGGSSSGSGGAGGNGAGDVGPSEQRVRTRSYSQPPGAVQPTGGPRPTIASGAPAAAVAAAMATVHQNGVPVNVKHGKRINSSDLTVDESDDVLVEGSLGFLDLGDGGRGRYIGNTHFAYIANELGYIRKYLKDASKYSFPNSPVPCPPSGDPMELCHDPDGGLVAPTGTVLASDDGGYSLASQQTPSSDYVFLDETIINGLPTRVQCDILHRYFLLCVHSVYALINPAVFFRHYTEFWEFYDRREEAARSNGGSSGGGGGGGNGEGGGGGGDGGGFRNPTFIPLLYAVLYGGALACSQKLLDGQFPRETRSSLAGRLNHKVIETLNAMAFLSRPHVPGLIAFAILETMSVKEEEPMVSQLSFSLILKLAESLGLHREPSKFGLTPEDAETRRRLWWHVVWRDALSFTVTGWPPMVTSETYWDVDRISEVKDCLHGTDGAARYLERVDRGEQSPDACEDPMAAPRTERSHVSTVLVVQQGKYSASTALRSLSKILLGVHPIGAKQFMLCEGILKELEDELNERISRIPEPAPDSELPFPFSPDSDSAPYWFDTIPHGTLDRGIVETIDRNWIAYYSFARKWLKMMVDKAYCLLHKPFLRQPRSSLWARFRTIVLPYAQGYLADFVDITTNPLYEAFIWAWPGIHQPLHAIMILLVDLYGQPHSSEAPRSRRLIDTVFELVSPDGGRLGASRDTVVGRHFRERSHATWAMLKDLRAKAWRRAGIDPEIVWTSPERSPSKKGQGDNKTPRPASDIFERPATTTGGPAVTGATATTSAAAPSAAAAAATNNHTAGSSIGTQGFGYRSGFSPGTPISSELGAMGTNLAAASGLSGDGNGGGPEATQRNGAFLGPGDVKQEPAASAGNEVPRSAPTAAGAPTPTVNTSATNNNRSIASPPQPRQQQHQQPPPSPLPPPTPSATMTMGPDNTVIGASAGANANANANANAPGPPSLSNMPSMDRELSNGLAETEWWDQWNNLLSGYSAADPADFEGGV